VQISLGGVITLGYELLSGAIGQQTFYLWAMVYIFPKLSHKELFLVNLPG
jgi:hypothetical protein